MMVCSSCKENMAVVFITKIMEGKQTQEGLCLSCAKKQGIGPVNQILEQQGITDDDIEEINKSMGNLLENIDFNTLGKTISESGKNFNSGIFDTIKEADNDFKSDTKVKTIEKKPIKKKILDQFGTNITDKAKDGKIDKVIGRSHEIDRVIQILNRRTKNNAVLIGEPGVGKTAIAEGLAVKIFEKKVPAKLFNTEIYLLDMTSIVAGTQFRGQFESRMKSIIEEAKTLGNIILVIDELHNIMGAGEAEGAMNAANILKPALSRGEIQIIGATTLNEYRRHIEKDSALERRFQPVIVDEPSVEDSIEILIGIKGYYEDFHKIKITDEIIKDVVLLSERYITDRFLPDKAIDVLDEAGSKANLKNVDLVELINLKEELSKVQAEKETAISSDSIEDYQKAADLKVHECRLNEEIKCLEEKNKPFEITLDDVAAVIESWTKIPVQKITEIEAKKLLNLEDKLHGRVIGQHQAVKSLSRAIRRTRADFRKKKKPASFIFVGPTGVGKTELVRALACELFENEETIVRLDMSEYMEKHTVSKLIGSPPGYVGYDDGGQLTEKVRRKPYSIILMDEIEKAHPDVFNIMLQILEDGQLTDSHGRLVSFKNTVIIMTSNAGTSTKSSGIGFGSDSYKALEGKVKDALKESFKPEFLNRVDEIIVFTELNKEELAQIVDLMLLEVTENVKEKGIDFTITEKAREFIIKDGYDPKYGARPLRRTIQKHIEDELSELYIMGELENKTKVEAEFEIDKIVFKY